MAGLSLKQTRGGRLQSNEVVYRTREGPEDGEGQRSMVVKKGQRVLQGRREERRASIQRPSAGPSSILRPTTTTARSLLPHSYPTSPSLALCPRPVLATRRPPRGGRRAKGTSQRSPSRAPSIPSPTRPPPPRSPSLAMPSAPGVLEAATSFSMSVSPALLLMLLPRRLRLTPCLPPTLRSPFPAPSLLSSSSFARAVTALYLSFFPSLRALPSCIWPLPISRTNDYDPSLHLQCASHLLGILLPADRPRLSRLSEDHLLLLPPTNDLLLPSNH